MQWLKMRKKERVR